MVVRRMSSPLSHNVQVRVLVVEDHVALADRIGEGLRDEWPLTGGFSNAADANGAFSAICPCGQRQPGQRHGDSGSCPTESR